MKSQIILLLASLFLLQDMELPTPKTKQEFDKYMLVKPTNERHWHNYHGTISFIGEGRYRAKTIYGWYLRQGNTIIADGPGGKKYYFAYDDDGNSIDMLDPTQAIMPFGGQDRRVLVPSSCKVCHEKNK